MDNQLCFTKAFEAPKENKNVLNERAEVYGIDTLMNEEVISLLTGINVETVRNAINDFGMSDIIKYINALKLTKTQQRKLELLNLYYKRMLVAEHKEKPVINSSTAAGDFCKNLFIGRSYEAFYILCLNTQNYLNYAALIHEGTINESPVYPRLLIEAALKYRANSVILAHNHPGTSSNNNLNPSSADIDITKKIVQAMNSISISVMDHVIVSGDCKSYLSFAERGLL